jgi:hypothetical protein
MRGNTQVKRSRPRGALWLAVLAAALLVIALNASSASATWWKPPAKPTWYWQLSGTLKTNKAVEIYDVDGYETTAKQVTTLHGQGKHVVCYIDVGGAEEYRPDYGQFLKLEEEGHNVLGAFVEGWPEESWINVRELKYIQPIMKARFEMCKEKGFDAVEPDEMEAYLNENGVEPPLTSAEQLAYNKWIAETVHSLGMAVLQKEDGPQTKEQVSLFDGALVEECNQYGFCNEFVPYVEAGKPVLNAEYAWKKSQFCANDEKLGFMGARFNLALNGNKFETCW